MIQIMSVGHYLYTISHWYDTYLVNVHQNVLLTVTWPNRAYLPIAPNILSLLYYHRSGQILNFNNYWRIRYNLTFRPWPLSKIQQTTRLLRQNRYFHYSIVGEKNVTYPIILYRIQVFLPCHVYFRFSCY